MKRIILSCIVWVSLWSAVRAQEIPARLSRGVEAYLDVREDEQGWMLLAELLKDEPTAEQLAAALRATGGELAGTMRELIPWRDQHLVAEVRIPEGHDRSKDRAPVLFDISGGHMIDWLKPEGTICVSVANFTPPEFSDEGRDAFLKVLRRVAHRYHGDPDRLWLTGFSWAAHASWDTALHRPGWLCGIASFGGGPRRSHFRLMDHLEGLALLAGCGAQDDPELIWNLREVERLATNDALDYDLTLDPRQGHSMPLEGQDAVAPAIRLKRREAPLSADGMRKGRLLADGPMVENPILRVDAVDEARTTVPTRIPVSASLSEDGKRRKTIAAMARSVARVDWKITRKGHDVELVLKPSGVREQTVLMREPWFQPGDHVTIRRGRAKVHEAVLNPDPRVMLEEARRSGERLRLVLGRVTL